MTIVFADAGYWIALFNLRDALHNRAIVASQMTQAHSIVTSRMAEFLNHYASMGERFRQRAVEVVEIAYDDHFRQAGFIPLLRDSR
jgi:uncharacterized protein